jgi:hypothetical protein
LYRFCLFEKGGGGNDSVSEVVMMDSEFGKIKIQSQKNFGHSWDWNRSICLKTIKKERCIFF